MTLVTLEAWADKLLGGAVRMETVRRWNREGKICPKFQKMGRQYFGPADAVYTDKPTSLIARIHADETQRRAV